MPPAGRLEGNRTDEGLSESRAIGGKREGLRRRRNMGREVSIRRGLA